MKKIAVFTSGGDAPGMNALVRSVTRTALSKGIEVIGVYGGYSGMIEGNFIPLGRKETANIISYGGTILHTSRSKEFMHAGGRSAGAKNLKDNGIEGVVACGGDGTFHGAHALRIEHQIPIVGIPATIDNDLYGTQYTIGYDTAINTAAQAIDKIRDTAYSHNRVFIIEVMGRHAGFIAMDVGIACGAEFIAVPETVTDIDQLYQRILQQKGRRTIIIVGEGDEFGGAMDFAKILEEKYEINAKVTILGHVQRGGSPTVRDRVLASHLGKAAVEALLEGKTDVMIGKIHNEITYTSLAETWEKKKAMHEWMIELSDLLA
ncbi:6-phosphofructokinase [Bacteroidota bacterium]